MSKTKPNRKFITFTKNSADFENVKEDIKSGWSVVSLIKNGKHYVGIMEQNLSDNGDSLFLPPRKKIKILPK